MLDSTQPKRALTQQSAAKRDRNALNRADKHDISDAEIINKLAANHSKPNSPEAFAAAAGSVLHTRCNMERESPIHDAVTAIIKERAFSSMPSGQPA